MNGTDGYAVFDDGSALNGRTTTGYYLRKMLDEEYTDYSKAWHAALDRHPGSPK